MYKRALLFVTLTSALIGIAYSVSSSMANSQISIKGTSTGRGVVCYQFKMESGENISLTGDIASLRKSGISATLVGNWQEYSNCQQGRTFSVQEVHVD